MRRSITLLWIALWIATAAFFVQAQEVPAGVFITTQDFSTLRAGPGTAFKRLAVIPPSTTLAAVGRTSDASWIQVQHGELHGWIASWLLVWSGDMMGLPLDGITPAPFARKAGPKITVTKGMIVRAEQFAKPGERVELPAPGATVELTGRLGSGESYWLQFWYNGRYYWVGNWSLHLVGSGAQFNQFPDGAYTYAYGRLIGQIDARLDNGQQAYFAIRSIWDSLAGGSSFSCDEIPDAAKPVKIIQTDVDSQPIFIPSIRAIETAISYTNRAITALQTACSSQGIERFLTTEVVDNALNDLDTAQRNFNLARTLLPPLANRDPALGGTP